MPMTSVDFEKLNSKNPKEKYSFVKELLLIGRENPNVLYPYLPQIVDMLDSEKNIIVWAGIELLGDLSKVDLHHKVTLQIPRLYSYLNTGKMITANHAVASLCKIAREEVDLQKEIIIELLKIKSYKYDTEECKNIVYGNIIKEIRSVFIVIRDEEIRGEVIRFVKEQVNNTRNATKKKAEKFLKIYSK